MTKIILNPKILVVLYEIKTLIVKTLIKLLIKLKHVLKSIK